MTYEEFIEGFAAGKRKALVCQKPGTGWVKSMDYLCNTVITLPEEYLDYGYRVHFSVGIGWMLDERDLVRFVDDEEENKDEQN